LKFGIGFPAEADSKTVCTTWVWQVGILRNEFGLGSFFHFRTLHLTIQ
jgi:hypothetical protein